MIKDILVKSPDRKAEFLLPVQDIKLAIDNQDTSDFTNAKQQLLALGALVKSAKGTPTSESPSAVSGGIEEIRKKLTSQLQQLGPRIKEALGLNPTLKDELLMLIGKIKNHVADTTRSDLSEAQEWLQILQS